MAISNRIWPFLKIRPQKKPKFTTKKAKSFKRMHLMHLKWIWGLCTNSESLDPLLSAALSTFSTFGTKFQKFCNFLWAIFTIWHWMAAKTVSPKSKQILAQLFLQVRHCKNGQFLQNFVFWSFSSLSARIRIVQGETKVQRKEWILYNSTAAWALWNFFDR